MPSTLVRDRPSAFADHDSDESVSDNEPLAMDKDATEEELERLVFGDSAGFRQGITGFTRGGQLVRARDDDELADDAGSQLEDMADADLFFVDAGPDAAAAKAVVPAAPASDDDDEGPLRDAPAWEDSDDERLVVSLASVPRLRKLRRTEDEDVINGKEYTRRLRRQFERLRPAPEWANPAAAAAARKPAKKKRRVVQGDGSSAEESSSDEDMDDFDDDQELSAQPLAKLLQDADALTRSSAGTGKKRKLRPEVLDIQRTKDVGTTQPSAITSLSFHPTLPLLLSSGPSSTLYLHHVQPQPPHPNPLLTSLHIKRTPLTTTAFHPSPGDARIFLSARRRYFHIWNLQTGAIDKVTRVYGHQHEQRSMERFALSPDGAYMALLGSVKKGGGVVNILDAHTLQWRCQARVEGRGGIADLAWWANGRGLAIAAKNGEISEFDVERGRVVARWQDEGAVGTSVIALGGRSGREGFLGGDRWVAVGSSSGVVNIYDRRAWPGAAAAAGAGAGAGAKNAGVPERPAPTRALDHLTTPVSHLKFSPDGQLLAMASRWKRDALRLVHLPSCSVYRNWPTSGTPLGRISAVAWGDGGVVGEEGGAGEGSAELMLAVANEGGRIRLWEVRS